MEGKAIQCLPREVVVGESLFGVEAMSLGIVLGSDLVVHDPLRKRCGRVDGQGSIRKAKGVGRSDCGFALWTTGSWAMVLCAIAGRPSRTPATADPRVSVVTWAAPRWLKNYSGR